MISRPLSRTEMWGLALLVFALTLGVGLRGRLVENRVNWDGLAAVAHAYDVFHAQPHANLAMIGFVQPPLPALLQLAAAVVTPALAVSGLAANLMGALSITVAALLLLGIAAAAGLTRPWRWALTALFVLHPMVIGPAATGSPLALLLALLMGACWALWRWRQTEGLRDLIAASVLLAAVVITRYEAVFIVLGAAWYLAWRVRKGGGSWSKLEGTMITFGLPIAYVIVLWIGANWAIMGDPWYFLRRSFPAPASGSLAGPVVRVSLVCLFPILALVYNQMRGAGRDDAPARPVAWLTMTAIVAPLLFPRVFGALDEPSDWDRLMTVVAMVLAGGYAMIAVLGGARARGERQPGPWGGTLTIAAGSLALMVWLVNSGAGLPMKVSDAWMGRGPLADDGTEVIRAAERLRATELPAGPQHLVAGWPGFALVLFSGQTGRAQVVQLVDLPQELARLGPGSRLVVLQEGTSLVPTDRTVKLWSEGQWTCYQFR